MQILSGVVTTLLDDLKSGTGDKDRRRQVEEWMRTLAEKYPEFQIETGLRDYYLAEAERLRVDFDKVDRAEREAGAGQKHRVVPRSRRGLRRGGSPRSRFSDALSRLTLRRKSADDRPCPSRSRNKEPRRQSAPLVADTFYPNLARFGSQKPRQ